MRDKNVERRVFTFSDEEYLRTIFLMFLCGKDLITLTTTVTPEEQLGVSEDIFWKNLFKQFLPRDNERIHILIKFDVVFQLLLGISEGQSCFYRGTSYSRRRLESRICIYHTSLHCLPPQYLQF